MGHVDTNELRERLDQIARTLAEQDAALARATSALAAVPVDVTFAVPRARLEELADACMVHAPVTVAVVPPFALRG